MSVKHKKVPTVAVKIPSMGLIHQGLDSFRRLRKGVDYSSWYKAESILLSPLMSFAFKSNSLVLKRKDISLFYQGAACCPRR